MAVRIISGVVAIPILLFFIIVGGDALWCAVLLLSLIGLYELYKAVSGRLKPVHFVGFALDVFYFCCIRNLNVLCADLSEVNSLCLLAAFGAFALGVILIQLILVFGQKNNNIHDGSITLFGVFYVGVLLSLICQIRQCGLIYSWLPFVFAFGCDTGAYFIGSKFGKHKLTPSLSPKKSIEGAFGGVASACIITLVYFFCANVIYGDIPQSEIILFTAVSVFGSSFSQLGDLAASAIKRFTGIKDYGKIMPGHGGVLDRFDSVIFTLPIVFIVLLFI